MIKSKLFIGLLASTTVLTSCGSNESNKEVEATSPEPAVENVCTYSLNVEQAEILWTAYKYNQKTGVKGQFNSFQVEGANSSQEPSGCLNGASVNIDVESIDSGDPTRDPKILEHFFGTLENGNVIQGEIKGVDAASSKMDVAITMNNITKQISAPFTVENDVLEARMELTVNDWNGQEGIAALNQACEDLHKGSDGESVLWPDVSVIVVAPLSKTCE